MRILIIIACIFLCSCSKMNTFKVKANCDESCILTVTGTDIDKEFNVGQNFSRTFKSKDAFLNIRLSPVTNTFGNAWIVRNGKICNGIFYYYGVFGETENVSCWE